MLFRLYTFHNGTGNQFASGPCLVGKPDTHTIMRGHVLPLAAHHLRGNLPAEDYLWRQWEGFRPVGAPDANPCVTVDLMYREGTVAGKFVVDDFQSNPSVGQSSSGGIVSGTVSAPFEDRLDDPDTNFIQNGGPDAVGLAFKGVVMDAVSYTNKAVLSPPQETDLQMGAKTLADQSAAMLLEDVRAFAQGIEQILIPATAQALAKALADDEKPLKAIEGYMPKLAEFVGKMTDQAVNITKDFK